MMARRYRQRLHFSNLSQAGACCGGLERVSDVTLGIPNPDPGFNVIPNYTMISERGQTGTEDLAYVGITVNLANDGLTDA